MYEQRASKNTDPSLFQLSALPSRSTEARVKKVAPLREVDDLPPYQKADSLTTLTKCCDRFFVLKCTGNRPIEHRLLGFVRHCRGPQFFLEETTLQVSVLGSHREMLEGPPLCRHIMRVHEGSANSHLPSPAALGIRHICSLQETQYVKELSIS